MGLSYRFRRERTLTWERVVEWASQEPGVTMTWMKNAEDLGAPLLECPTEEASYLKLSIQDGWCWLPVPRPDQDWVPGPEVNSLAANTGWPELQRKMERGLGPLVCMG